MPRTQSKPRRSKSRGRRAASARADRSQPPRGPLAESPALRELAGMFETRAREAEAERERQRERAAAIARAEAEQAEHAERADRHRRRRYRERNRPRARQECRILDLLRRGAGVTQILREISLPSDGLSDLRRRATHIEEMLDAVTAGDPRTSRVRMTARDQQRTGRFLATVLDGINSGRAPDLGPIPELDHIPAGAYQDAAVA